MVAKITVIKVIFPAIAVITIPPYYMSLSTFDVTDFFSGRHERTAEAFRAAREKLCDFIPANALSSQEMPDVPAPERHLTLSGSLNPYTGPWGYAQAAHLLRRTGFGLKKQELDQLLALNMESAVNLVLTTPATLPPPPVNNYNNPDFTDPVVAPGQTWVTAPLTSTQRNTALKAGEPGGPTS